MALAAGVSGLALGIIGSGLLRSPAGTGGAAASFSAVGDDVAPLLTAALNSFESGAHAQEGDRRVGVVLSFRAADGKYCRIFEVTGGKARGEGMACRQSNQWQLVAWDGTHDVGAGFQPAGGDALIDGMMDRLGGHAALEPAEERELIQAQWKRKPAGEPKD